ncbi:hypothetical protein F5Y09DRAFT_197498 [Xylaria sp. FL1042]|nr:hypothetical protein F5Y09DRAFT_197498 [Xylaria sp. FL1042]
MEIDVPTKGPLFLQLPVELFLQILEYLGVADFLAFRLVCRHIESMLFDSFRKEFFTERRFSITFHSLKALVDITRSSRLKDCLKRLTIGLDRLHTTDALPRFAEHWDDVNHTIREEPVVKAGIDPYKLEALTREQNFLISSGEFQLMLSKALSNLPYLEEFSLRDHNIPRKNRRTGMKKLLVSYGWSHILQETGIDFTGAESHLDNYDDSFVDIVFSATLLALARSQIQVNLLTADISHGNVGLSSSAFSIPNFFYQDIHPTLFNLRSLDLSVSFIQVPLGSYSNRSNSFLKWQKHQLFGFLQQTPNLVSLRVQSKEQGSFADGIVGWLATLLDSTESKEPSQANGAHSPTEIPGDPKALMLPYFEHQFQYLRELELGNMKAPARTVCKILRCLSDSLRCLTFSKMALCVKSDDDELDNNPRKPNAWSAVFLDMLASLKLEQLSLSSLEHHTPSCSRHNGHPVAFFPSSFGVQSGPSNGLLYVWSHQGSADTIREFLEELHSKTIILCRECKKRNVGYRSVEEILDLNH